jgi:aerobic-type carbon monoxide dehydrogenase small subunit (CoxS/CutS family)
MSEARDVNFIINGISVRRTAKVRQHLVDFLREEFELTGPHLGCEHGVCGACTVRVNGRAVRGCLMLAVQVDGAEVTTIEGLTQNGEVADLQEEFVRHNALQCGFCTPGMVTVASELLAANKTMTRAEIREFIAGNYCRCTGYHAIVDAIEATIAKRLAAR